jgi:hypothetical protein
MTFSNVDIAFPDNRADYLVGEAWFQQTYPESYRRYGAPVEIVWGANHDALANALNEGAARLVYHNPEDRFYYLDHNREAYCSVEPQEKILALVRAILRRAAESMVRSEKIVWFKIWDEKAIKRVVDAARAVLTVDHTFFHGATGHQRYIEGQYLEATTAPSYQKFAEEQVRKMPNAILTIRTAYQGYWKFCSAKKLPPLPQQEFKSRFRGESIERFGIGLRHDLRVGDKIAQGWIGLTLEAIQHVPIHMYGGHTRSEAPQLQASATAHRQ